ncbi:hypothetical protein B0H63DRAFT_38773 [Podospora didyma]|uniref:Uncharacterized protein n=1 Tax=Podospora didyma TaxID=330526 RepID=A0AAE0P6I7_9PEZI|nr:hypothetical protein B0H63DRAFT_38773 [Podospora didyma]
MRSPLRYLCSRSHTRLPRQAHPKRRRSVWTCFFQSQVLKKQDGPCLQEPNQLAAWSGLVPISHPFAVRPFCCVAGFVTSVSGKMLTDEGQLGALLRGWGTLVLLTLCCWRFRSSLLPPYEWMSPRLVCGSATLFDLDLLRRRTILRRNTATMGWTAWYSGAR